MNYSYKFWQWTKIMKIILLNNVVRCYSQSSESLQILCLFIRRKLLAIISSK